MHCFVLGIFQNKKNFYADRGCQQSQKSPQSELPRTAYLNTETNPFFASQCRTGIIKERFHTRMIDRKLCWPASTVHKLYMQTKLRSAITEHRRRGFIILLLITAATLTHMQEGKRVPSSSQVKKAFQSLLDEPSTKASCDESYGKV